MFRRLPVALAIVLSAAPAAWCQFSTQEMKAAQKDPGAFTIDESSIKIQDLGPTVKPADIPPPTTEPGGGNPLPVLNEIINTGLKIWKIIADNHPVVDVRTQYATALPKGQIGWADMGGWQPPQGTVYALTAKNVYGVNVINVRYQVLRTYGGSYQGKGKYLTAVTVEPLLVEVAWGYHFTMDASVPDTSVVNVGTSGDPVAGMMADLSWDISTALKDSRGKGLYFLQGDGAYKEIGGPFSSQAAKLREAAAHLGKSVRFE